MASTATSPSKSTSANLLQFTPFSSIVQPAFWHELTKLKIDVLKLSQDAVPILGSYSVGRSVLDRETGQEVALGCNLVVGGDAFAGPEGARWAVYFSELLKGTELTVGQPRPPPHSVTVRGALKNFNTIEDFKNVNKQELFNNTAKEMWAKAEETKDPSHLLDFLLITFADLKKYKYYYWFAFPAFAAVPPWEKVGELSLAQEVISTKGVSGFCIDRSRPADSLTLWTSWSQFTKHCTRRPRHHHNQ